MLARDRQQLAAGDPERIVPAHLLAAQPHDARALRILDPAEPELAAVAQEHAVHRVVLAHPDAHQLAVARAGTEVATNRAVGADRGRLLQVPYPGAVAEQLVGEDAGGAELDQVSRERALER